VAVSVFRVAAVTVLARVPVAAVATAILAWGTFLATTAPP